jgi:hypothetical protein
VNVIATRNPHDLFPADIHLAQLARRLNQPPSEPPPPPPAPKALNLILAGNPATGPYAVEAKTNISGDLKVQFFVNGNLFRVESSPPYSIFGDNGTPYRGTLGAGTHIIEAKAYAQTATPVAQAQLTIVEPSTTQPPVTPGKSIVNSATMIRSSQNFAKDHPVQHLWDGCLDGSPKCSAGAGNIGSFWIEFDLGKPHELTSARLFGDADGNWLSTSWTLEYKQNVGDSWSPAFKNINALRNDWSAQSLSGTGRYVRVQVFGNQQMRATQARELELYGTAR